MAATTTTTTAVPAMTMTTMRAGLETHPHYINREWFFDAIADIKLLRKIKVSSSRVLFFLL
jgi:hypothetical protein